jgi:drug/metabolite transporter (DMT)-like permease
VIIGLVTAVAASTCYGLGSVLQAVGSRRSAREEAAAQPDLQRTEHGGPSLSSTAKAVVTWEFLLGTVLDFIGFGLAAVASRLLPLFLSQTVISANLVITALFSIKLLGLRPRRPEWLAIGTVCGALVLLTVAAGPEGHTHTSIASHWVLLAISVLLIAVGSPLVRRLGTGGAVAAGLLSGLLFGVLGIGVRVLGGLSPFDLSTVLGDPALYAIAVGGLGGMYLHTVALQLGSVNGATAALVVGETVLPGMIGVVWLGDATRAGLTWLGLVGFVLAVVGAVAVAHYGEGEGALPHDAEQLTPAR